MRKVMVVLAMLTLLASVIVIGCGKSEEEKSEQVSRSEEVGRNEEVGKTEERILGKYFNEDDYEQYIEIKKDGTVYVREKFLGDYNEMMGSWKKDGDEILLIGPLGLVERCRIEDNNIIDPDGEKWLRHGEIVSVSETPNTKISKSRIVGRYITEKIGEKGSYKEPGLLVFNKDGTITNTISGRWQTEGDKIKFYEGDREIRSQRLSDDTILAVCGIGLVKKEGAEIIKTLEVEVPLSIPRSFEPQSFGPATAPPPPSPPPSATRQTRQQRAYEPRSYRPKQEREQVKQEALTTELKKIILWSDYVSKNGRYNLKPRQDGTFFEESSVGKWKIENGLVQIYVDDKKVYSGGRIEDNNIIFEEFHYGQKVMSKLIKQR